MTEPVRISMVTLVVGSTAASADFYRRLGLAVPDDEAGVHVEIRQDAAPISLELDAVESAGLWNASWRTGGGTNVIVGAVGARPRRRRPDLRRPDRCRPSRRAAAVRRLLGWALRHRRRPGRQPGRPHEPDRTRPRATWPPDPSPDP